MKQTTFYKKFTFILLVFLTIKSTGQNGITNITTPVGNGDYKDQQEVHLKPPTGKVTPTGIGEGHLFIDPSISVNSPYTSSGTYGINPVNFNIDLSKPVGTIPYSFNVSPIGSAECNVPIQVPIGTNKMMPSISFNYSSLTNLGELGVGWSIGGLQSISRMPQTLYHNNNIKPVDLTNSDVFALNGNRLIPTIGVNGDPNTIYTTEQNQFYKITSFGSAGSEPDWFKVEGKDGLVMEFGNTGNSQYVPANKIPIYEWKLSKVYDQNGNYIEYEYYNSNGEVLIKEIRYTGNTAAGITPYNTIKFYYNFSNEQNTLYVNGGEINQRSILRQVNVLSENVLAAQYNFTYSNYFNNSFLTEINLKGSDNTELNGLKFSYQNDVGAPVFQNTSGLFNTALKQYQIIDFTGDGIKDLISFEGGLILNGSGAVLWQNWRAMKNNGNSVFTEVNNFNFNPGSGFSPIGGFPVTKNAVGSMNYLSYDFNGDNKEDLLQKGTIGLNDIFNIFLSNGNSGFSSTPNKVITIPKINPSFTEINGYWIIDLNGDQKLDLLYYDNKNPNGTPDYDLKVWLDMSNATSTPDYVLNTTVFRVKDARPLDIDGDGKAELILETYSPGNTFSKLSLNNLNQLVINSLPYSVALAYNQPNYSTFSAKYVATTFHVKLDGDYNGDGKTDYIISQDISGSAQTGWTYELFLNKGDGTYTPGILLNKAGLGLKDQPTLSNFNNNSIQKGYYYTADMNADGKTDIIELSGNNIKVYYSKGVSGDYFFSETYPIPSGYSISIKDFEFADIDGNGVTDIMFSNSNSSSDIPFIMYFYKGAISKNIKEVVDGYGRKVEFTFKPLTDAILYTQNQTKVYPLSAFTSPLYVVSEAKSSNGIGGLNSDTYLYENAVVHKQGKGLVGFSKITKSNIITNVKQVDKYSNNSAKYNLIRTKTSVYNLSTNALISDEVVTNQNLLVSGISYWPTIIDILKTNYLQNFTTHMEYEYDIYGNVTLERTRINNNFDLEQTTYSSFVSNGSWLPSKPTIVTKSIARTGKPSYDRNSTYTYDSFGHVLSETNEPSDPKVIFSSFTYDFNTGVPIIKNISSPSSGLPVKNWQYAYDSKFRLVTQETNVLNQVTQYKYNFMWAKPTELKDIEGLKTTLTYDGFGKLKSTTTPDNTTLLNTYDWVTAGDFVGGDPLSTSNCLYKIKSSKVGFPESTEYYDMFSRQIRTESDGFNSKNYQMLSYDAKGNKLVETGMYQLILSNPFTPLLKTNTYDNLNRLSLVSVTDGTSTKNTTYNYTYSGVDMSVIETQPDGKIKTSIIDPSGLLKTVIDNGGSINYTYYSNRQPETISVNGNQANYFEYDIYAKQTKLTDRDAGITLYNYNAYGQLESTTDANNKTYNFVYDALDRPVTKSGPDGVYSYQYITSGSGLNKILQETAPNGYYKKLYYDNLSRVNKTEENIDGQSYNTQYFFDQYSRLQKTQYPSNFATVNVYNANGFLTQIKNNQNNQLIWSCDEVNPLGQVSKYTSGNSIQTLNTYNNFGFLTQQNTPGVQNLSYNFNINNSNLNSRTDLILNKTETFTYDNLDRLTQIQIPSLPNFNTTYNNNGNVLTKSGLSSLTYKSNKPDAINEVDNPSGAISSNQQDITYTSFNKVQNITEDIYQYDIFYGSNQQRKKTNLYISGNLNKTRIYVGNYEKTIQGTNTQEVHYINTPSGITAMYVINNSVGTMYYTHGDHQSTILKATDASGNIVANLNYDAWGRRRNNTTWDYSSATTPPQWLYRGYTGHEHLDEFALINMNGRVYDPILGQMLSPDPSNQLPDYTQNYNRYAYAFNNPLKYNDPSGNDLFDAFSNFFNGLFHSPSVGGGHWGNPNLATNQAAGIATEYAKYTGKSQAILFTITTGGLFGNVLFGGTLALMETSLGGSIFGAVYSGGETDISVNFGVGSYNFSKNELGYLGKETNSDLDNLSYFLGFVTNVSDGVNFRSYLKAQNRQDGAGKINEKELKKYKNRKDGFLHQGNYTGSSGKNNPLYRYVDGAVPTNDLDGFAFNHDVGYYYKGADGGLDAFLNTRVLPDDIQLIRGASTLSGTWPNGVKVGFGIIVGFKYAIKYSYLLNLKDF